MSCGGCTHVAPWTSGTCWNQAPRGLLRYRCGHVVDQMVWLLGPVTTVTAHLDWVDLPEGRTDAGLVIDLIHDAGVRSFGSPRSSVSHQRELWSYGSVGSYRAVTSDIQAQAVLGGAWPAADLKGWGYDPPEHWGTGTPRRRGGEEFVPSERGATTTSTTSSRPAYVAMRQSWFLRPRVSGPSRSWTSQGSVTSVAGRWRSDP